MKPTFDLAMRLLLRHEGGFVFLASDPGGMTNLGVTKGMWEKYVDREVDEKEMRELTPAKVTPFYKTRYWDAIHGDDLPAGVDYCVFDTCVNSGPGRATKILQDALGVTIDGVLGPATLSAVAKHHTAPLISAYTTARLDFLKKLPRWDTFGKGWKKRVEEVEQEAKQFAGTEAGA